MLINPQVGQMGFARRRQNVQGQAGPAALPQGMPSAVNPSVDPTMETMPQPQNMPALNPLVGDRLQGLFNNFRRRIPVDPGFYVDPTRFKRRAAVI